MPRDIQEQFRDYENCAICKRNTPDNEIRTAVAIKEGVGRVFSICEYCVQKCETDKVFDENVTRYVFEQKIGKVGRIGKR